MMEIAQWWILLCPVVLMEPLMISLVLEVECFF